MKILTIWCVGLCVFLCSCERISTAMMLMQANTSYNQGKYDKAIELYQKLIEINPANPEYHYQMGLSYFSSGDKTKVQQKANRLRKLGRDDLAQSLEQLLTQLSAQTAEQSKNK